MYAPSLRGSKPLRPQISRVGTTGWRKQGKLKEVFLQTRGCQPLPVQNSGGPETGLETGVAWCLAYSLLASGTAFIGVLVTRSVNPHVYGI
jgi:hypothetical protein